MASRRTRLRQLSLLAFLVPCGAACNAIWGADAPILVGGDGGGGHDAPPGDVAPADVGTHDAKKDAPAGDAGRDATLDAMPDTMADAMPKDAKPIFDGNCACDAGSCPPVVLATGLANPEEIVTDTNGVYWTTNGTTTPSSGTVGAATFDGKVTVLAPAQSNPRGIGVASGKLAWANVSLGAIEICALPGCAAPTSITSKDTPGLGDLVLDSADVFFESINSIESCATAGCGGTPTTLSALGGQGGIALDATNVYWADETAGTIDSCPRAGCGTPSVLIMGETDPTALVQSGGNLYWTDTAGEIRACSSAECPFTAQTLVPGGAFMPLHLAADGTSVYWTDSSGFIAKVAVSGGAVVELAKGESSASGIAVGTSCVFWVDDLADPDGEVKAVAK
jgi:hypothetical protein